jgi:protein SCO1/2
VNLRAILTVRNMVPMLLLLVAGAAGCSDGASSSSPVRNGVAIRPTPDGTASGPSYFGAQPGVPIAVPAITLTTDSGRRYPLRGDATGRLRLIFFGYVNCPDVCPTTMADLAAALRRVPDEVRERTAVLFVTTDPARDTGPVLDTWLSRYDDSFMGLTGSDADIRRAAEGLKVAVLGKEQRAGGGYDIAHGTQVLAVTPDNTVRLLWFSGTSVKQYASDITQLVRSAVSSPEPVAG